MVPVLIQLKVRGIRHLPVTDARTARTEVLAAGGPPMWEAFMDELRGTDLGPRARRQPAPSGPTVVAQVEPSCAAVLDRAATAPAKALAPRSAEPPRHDPGR